MNVIGTILIEDGKEWRVEAIAETFYIVTRNDVEGEPTQSSDIRKIDK